MLSRRLSIFVKPKLTIMKKSFNVILLLIAGITVSGCGGAGSSGAEGAAGGNRLPEWALGGFVRPAEVNPVIQPDPKHWQQYHPANY